MEKGNVLVIGDSGVGKSTLINAVLGEDRAETGWGTKVTTDKLKIYESEEVAFRIIDTIGFEPSLIKAAQAANAVKKWSHNSAKDGNEDSQINVIWFCVDGTFGKLLPKTIKDLARATSMWKSVPVIAVITKSYSVPEREKNIEMVNEAFARQKRYAENLRKVIPVVAATYVLNDCAYAAPEGITELIDATNEWMPEGLKAGEMDIAAFKLARKRAAAHGMTGAFTAAAVVIGAVPMPISDAALLAPIETAAVNSLATIYGIGKDEISKNFLNSIVEVGTVSTTAKVAVRGLKLIRGVKLSKRVLNAIIAGSIVAALCEGTIYAFEQVYLGEKSVADAAWIRKVMESQLSSRFIDTVNTIPGKITGDTDGKTIAAIVKDAFKRPPAAPDEGRRYVSASVQPPAAGSLPVRQIDGVGRTGDTQNGRSQ